MWKLFSDELSEASRRLAAIDQVRYESQREDLVRVGGARDKEAFAAMDALDQARFKTLSPDMQKLWNLWDRIDKEVPTMTQRTFGKQG